MSQINPFIPIIALSPQAQREAAVARDAIVRRSKEKQRNSGQTIEHPDEFIHSAEQVIGVNDEEQAKKQPKKHGKKQSQKQLLKQSANQSYQHTPEHNQHKYPPGSANDALHGPDEGLTIDVTA
jgi:dynactin complex subunit